ncbi:hypothetical protein RCL1_001678 [Eukaryota sp. TZLM3-RCL]
MDPRSSTPIRKNQKNDHRPRSSIPSRQGLQDPHQHRRLRLGRRRSDMARNASPVPLQVPPNRQKGDPLSFFSRILQNSQKNWSTIQKELYAIILILTESTLSGFLLSRKLTIFTDHKNIAFLYSAPEKEPYREAMDPHPGRIFN